MLAAPRKIVFHSARCGRLASLVGSASVVSHNATGRTVSMVDRAPLPPLNDARSRCRTLVQCRCRALAVQLQPVPVAVGAANRCLSATGRRRSARSLRRCSHQSACTPQRRRHSALRTPAIADVPNGAAASQRTGLLPESRCLAHSGTRGARRHISCAQYSGMCASRPLPRYAATPHTQGRAAQTQTNSRGHARGACRLQSVHRCSARQVRGVGVGSRLQAGCGEGSR